MFQSAILQQFDKSAYAGKIFVTLQTNNYVKMDRLRIGCVTDEVCLRDTASIKKIVKEHRIDLLVFPEMHDLTDDLGFPYLPKGETEVFEYEMNWAKEVGCAIVMGLGKNQNTNHAFNVFVNPFAKKNETKSQIYIKHTMTDSSAFEWENYDKLYQRMFRPIQFRNWRIGMTICYDGTFPIFSRLYGRQGVDLLVNSTGYDAKKSKWLKYHKVRSIENHCNSVVTMFCNKDPKKGNPPAYCFNRQGGAIPLEKCVDDYIYIYEVEYDDGKPEIDEYYDERKGSINNSIDLKIPEGHVEKLIEKANHIDKNIYCFHHKNRNVILCLIKGNDILKPEKVLQLLYNKRLDDIKNKSFVIVNQYKRLSKSFFQSQLDTVLKVRAVENLCAVILESDKFNKCYQSTYCKDSQIIKPTNGFYGIDLRRTNGPKHTGLHQNKQWNQNIEYLVSKLS